MPSESGEFIQERYPKQCLDMLPKARECVRGRATEMMGPLGEECVAMTPQEAGFRGGWNTMMMIVEDMQVLELPDELINAVRVKRVRDNRGDNFVAYFPKRLRGYLKGEIPGRKKGIRKNSKTRYGIVWPTTGYG